MNQISIYNMDADYKEMLNKVEFYKFDITTLQARLGEIAQKNNAPEVLSMVEHFQNQYIIQNEQADILRHDLNESRKNIEVEVNKNPVAVDHRKMNDNTDLRDKVAMYEKSMAELRNESIRFFAKWM
jgi:hypothetical protein